MTKYKIIYDKSLCIGAGDCERLSSKHWKIRSDGRADLLNATLKEIGRAHV